MFRGVSFRTNSGCEEWCAMVDGGWTHAFPNGRTDVVGRSSVRGRMLSGGAQFGGVKAHFSGASNRHKSRSMKNPYFDAAETNT